MTLLLEREVVRTLPTLRREAISWRANGDMVEISIELVNDSFERTESDVLVIEAAPFGAFIPNVPITSIAVGSMDPGERRTETVAVARNLLDRVAANPWNTALSQATGDIDALVRPDANVHWIGNLNVYFATQPDRAVERHCAFNLKVPAGSRIVSAFMIRDKMDCRVEFSGLADGWIGQLMRPAPYAVISILTPEGISERAHVTVNVIDNSDGRVVPVEFDFETVDGWGETIGCVKV